MTDDHLAWLPGETQEERKRRLNRLRTRRWRERHPEGGANASRKHREAYGWGWPSQRETGIWVRAYKESHPCADCGHKFPACAMDFDHRPGTEKVLPVGTMVAHGYSKASILAEMAKCDLVCACCHRVRTRDRRRKDK